MRVHPIVQASIALLLATACVHPTKLEWGLPDGGSEEVSGWTVTVSADGTEPQASSDLWVGLGGWRDTEFGATADTRLAAVAGRGDPAVRRRFEPAMIQHGDWAVPFASYDVRAAGVAYRLVLLDGWNPRVQDEQAYWLPAVLQSDRSLVVLVGPGPFADDLAEQVTRTAKPMTLALVARATGTDWVELPGGTWGELVARVGSRAELYLGETLQWRSDAGTWRWTDETGWERLPD